MLLSRDFQPSIVHSITKSFIFILINFRVHFQYNSFPLQRIKQLVESSLVWQRKPLKFQFITSNYHTLLISCFMLLIRKRLHGKSREKKKIPNKIKSTECLNNNSIVNLLDCYALSSTRAFIQNFAIEKDMCLIRHLPSFQANTHQWLWKYFLKRLAR